MLKRAFVVLAAVVAMIFVSGCADAGEDQNVTSREKVLLDGNGSKALFGGEIVGYRWNQVAGVKVELENNDSVQASFIAPETDKKINLIFRLATIENFSFIDGLETFDEVNVTIVPKAVNNIVTVNGKFRNNGPGDSGGYINIYTTENTMFVAKGKIEADDTFSISFTPIEGVNRYSIGTCRALSSFLIEKGIYVYNVHVEQFDGCIGSEW